MCGELIQKPRLRISAAYDTAIFQHMKQDEEVELANTDTMYTLELQCEESQDQNFK